MLVFVKKQFFLAVTLDEDNSLDPQSIQTKQREAQVSNKFTYVILTVLYSVSRIHLQDIYSNLKHTFQDINYCNTVPRYISFHSQK